MDALASYVAANHDRWLKELSDFLRIPSISTLPDHTAEVRRGAEWLRDASINRDRDLRLQYLAGMGLNQYKSAAIYADIVRYRRFPEDLFTGSETLKQSLRAAVEGAPGGLSSPAARPQGEGR